MMEKQREPKKTIQFKITNKCNYKCEYCVQYKAETNPQELENASNEVIDAFIDLLRKVEGCWQVSLLGGEAPIHPRFKEVFKEIIDNGHVTTLVTNFSYPVSYYKELSELGGDNFEFLFASLHLSQIKSIDDFIKKASEFNKVKYHKTGFLVMTVLTEENFEVVKDIRKRLLDENVNTKLQLYKDNKTCRYVQYSDKIKEYLKQENIKLNLENVMNKNLFGTICHAGYVACVVDEYGVINRCYKNQAVYNMGNIVGGKYKFFEKPIPCLANECNCGLFPANHMIRYDEVDITLAESLVEFSKIGNQAISEINKLTGLELKISI